MVQEQKLPSLGAQQAHRRSPTPAGHAEPNVHGGGVNRASTGGDCARSMPDRAWVGRPTSEGGAGGPLPLLGAGKASRRSLCLREETEYSLSRTGKASGRSLVAACLAHAPRPLLTSPSHALGGYLQVLATPACHVPSHTYLPSCTFARGTAARPLTHTLPARDTARRRPCRKMKLLRPLTRYRAGPKCARIASDSDAI